ncbi:Glycerophosphoryl diester phosphodiesterase [hydrothermal vent metagenome]|uniref:Glycerophosphoryl diester phosphodiesterase n=1 Tax=hydrothermal vent metagenome TaxID=652676 RepID=A0A3B0YA64_9ZZZZ
MAIPHLVAHRGLMETYPENTLISLESALLSGASFIEFDVQCTADGQLVVFHDTELLRTTGVKGNLFEMTYAELKHIRAHEPERFSLAFFNQRIPLLSDVVQLLQSYPRATAFVEIKEETLARFGTRQIMPELLKTLDIIHSQCIIISFDKSAIEYTKKHSDVLTGWVLREYNETNHQTAKKLMPDYLIVNHRKIPKNTDPWQGSWHWMVYDITDPELALHYASHNIPLIETRNISRMLEHPILALNMAPNQANL